MLTPSDIYLILVIAIVLALIWHVLVGDHKSNYPHLKQINRSIKAIHHQLPPALIRSFSESVDPTKIFNPSERDPVIATNKLAIQLIRYLKLPYCRVFVSFKAGLPCAGRVELTSSNDYFVELKSQHKNNPIEIAGIIAHEITHILLYRERLWFPIELENELLTDTTSAYLGVGWLTLNAYSAFTTIGASSSKTIHVEHKLGYLTPAEFGYVLGKRALWFKEQSGQFLTSPAAKRAFKKGFRKACAAYNQAPLEDRSLLASWLYHWNLYIHQKQRLSALKLGGANYKFEAEKIVFDCPACSQKLRLPIQKTVTATCSNCKSQLKCKT